MARAAAAARIDEAERLAGEGERNLQAEVTAACDAIASELDAATDQRISELAARAAERVAGYQSVDGDALSRLADRVADYLIDAIVGGPR